MLRRVPPAARRNARPRCVDIIVFRFIDGSFVVLSTEYCFAMAVNEIYGRRDSFATTYQGPILKFVSNRPDKGMKCLMSH